MLNKGLAFLVRWARVFKDCASGFKWEISFLAVWGDKMLKLLKGLGVVALAIWSIGSASAASVNEDIDVTYLSSASFSLSSLSLTLGSGPNLITGYSGTSYGSGSGTVFNEVVSLIAGDTYTFSFNGSFGSGSAPIIASSSSETGGGSFTFANGAAFNVSATLSPVPLPASFPLFAMALIGLGMIGYRTARAKHGVAAV
jgi:hypothetical protein